MIYGKLWCVVKPSVGIPLMLGAVAVGSFAVHVALLTNTDWVPKFLNGGPPAKVAVAPDAQSPAVAKAAVVKQM